MGLYEYTFSHTPFWKRWQGALIWCRGTRSLLLCALLQDIVKLDYILTVLCLGVYLNPLLLETVPWTIRTHPLLMVNIQLLQDVGQNVVSFIFQYEFCGAGNTSLKTQSMKKCSVKSLLTKQFNLTHSFLALGLTLV